MNPGDTPSPLESMRMCVQYDENEAKRCEDEATEYEARAKRLRGRAEGRRNSAAEFKRAVEVLERELVPA